MLSKRPELLILDFDGVVADSELLANTYLAEFLTQEGLPTTVDQSIENYMGRRWADTAARVSELLGKPIGDDFLERYRAFTDGRVRKNIEAVAGVAAFFQRHPDQRFCVASSSTPDWLDHCVDKFGFRKALGRNLFSATAVKNGKPAPDIFLYAAAMMEASPSACAVLEDSEAGVKAGLAAGMPTIGFLGGSHIRASHAARLTAAGAQFLAHDYKDVTRLLGLGGDV